MFLALTVMSTAILLEFPETSQASEIAMLAGPGDGEDAGCLFCDDAPEMGCSGDEHHAYVGQSGLGPWARAGGPHTVTVCRSGSCDTKHGDCTLAQGSSRTFGKDIEMVRGTIERGDPAAIAGILKQFPQRVVVNVERSAIQVLGCTGEVAAHIPLSNALVADISRQNSLVSPHSAVQALVTEH